MRKESLKFFKDLVSSQSPSGYEKEAASTWKNYTKVFADRVKVDVHGNVIGSINSKGAPRVMLSGHIDEIGYMINFIDENGFLYFRPIGGIDLHLIPGQRISIKTKKGNVIGIVGRKPIHLQKPDDRNKVCKLENMWIDIGAKNKKEAESKISIGDPAVPDVKLEPLQGNRVTGKSFDNRSGAFVVSECLRLLSSKRLKASVFSVASVQEEIGLRGATTSAYGISPDVGIAVDVTFATDDPGSSKKEIGDIRIGNGPVIARGPNINHKVFDLLVKTAEKEKIPYQIEGISRATGTDANVIQLNQAGVATGLVSIPNRYMHSPVELIDLTDLENAAKLVSAFILSLTKEINFIPY